MCILYFLIPILIGLICVFLGYRIGRMSAKSSDENPELLKELEACRKERERQISLYSSIKSDLESWKSKYNSLQSDYEGQKLKFSSPVAVKNPFDAELAASVFLKKITEDDLKIVEGIGPKIEELFHNAGIRTWKALSETSVEKCQQILDNAGEKFRIHKPATWPKQCELACLGKWNELKQWQDQMSGGKM